MVARFSSTTGFTVLREAVSTSARPAATPSTRNTTSRRGKPKIIRRITSSRWRMMPFLTRKESVSDSAAVPTTASSTMMVRRARILRII